MDEPLRAGEPLVPPMPRPEPTEAEPARPPAPRKKRRNRRRRHWFTAPLRGLFSALVGLFMAACVAGVAGAFLVYQHFAAGLPDVDGLRGYQPPVMSRVYANDGRLLAELASERRIFVPINAIPDMVKQAFISAEDRNFYTHKGVDPLAIARAAFTNFMQRDHNRRPIGASTITQQVARNMLLDNQLSVARKAKEAILALRIEKTLTKDQILELYLNEIYLGAGAYGVASAAESYFNKPLDRLTIGETAFLAALPKSPSNYNPFKYPDVARAQRSRVLDRMAEDHVLTPDQVAQAREEPIVPVAFKRPQVVTDADWFAEEVRRQLIQQFGTDTTTEGGLEVRTSLDPVLQVAADKALRAGLIKYDRQFGGWRGPVARLDANGLEHGWTELLAKVPRKPGMLPTWRLAVVLNTTDTEARVGWLSGYGERGAIPEPALGQFPLSDVTWARPSHGENNLGPTPKKISDVVQVGDVVMVEPVQVAAEPEEKKEKDKPGKAAPAAAAGLPRVTLRQIPGVQGALICMDPTSGRVLAMVGGFSFDQSQFNRATQAMRQPGSSVKPMVYLTALEEGISPNQMISNSELSIQVGNQLWEPENSGGDFGGPVSVKTALQFSMNVPTVRLAQKIGMAAVAKTAESFHMYDHMPHVLSGALGSVETTPMREIGAYAGIAAGGKEVIPTLIDSVQDRNGRIVWRPHVLECPNCGDPKNPPVVMDMRPQIADPYADRTLIDLMENVVQAGTGHAAGAGFNRPIAGKTGTTQDWGDAWFSGFTPDLVTTVWIGHDNNTSLGRHEEGGVVAAPIWHDFMAEAFKGRPVLQFPQAAGPRIAFSGPAPENRMAEGVIGGGGGKGGPPAPGAVHGGVDNKLGGLY
jgi:penicillin-binding protein 1A